MYSYKPDVLKGLITSIILCCENCKSLTLTYGEQDNEYAKDLVVYDINDAIVNYNDLDEKLFTKIAKAACPSIDPWDEN